MFISLFQYVYFHLCVVCVSSELEAEVQWLWSNRNSASEEVQLATTGKIKKYRRLTGEGDAYGQYLLGMCYFWGWGGVTQDHKRAAELHTLSAEQGNAWGQVQLGDDYLHGLGVTQNRDLARQWLRRSADQGFQFAKAYLKQEFPHDPNEASGPN